MNNLHCHWDAYTMLHPLIGLCIPLSLALGTAVFANSTGTVSTSPSTCSRKRKRNKEAESDSDNDLSEKCKKSRLVESSSEDEVEAYLLDTTLINDEHDGGAEKTLKPITTISFGTPTKPVSLQTGSKRMSVNGTLSPHSVAISAISPSRRAKRSDEESDSVSNARREWELRWFVCAHHAAFTAATAMSLRREIRRRKLLGRMWREIRKENIALKEDVKKLSLELYGFVEA